MSITHTHSRAPHPRLIVFASGTKTGGGSGFENLVRAEREGVLRAHIVAVVTNHKHGGVRARADKLGIPCIYYNGPYTAERYSALMQDTHAEWVALSGWLKMVRGLPKEKTFNIHPALLSQLNGRFGGKGMWGHHVHEAVKEALDNGEIAESGITMHFVTDEYDRGPVFFEHRIPLTQGMSVEDIALRVHKAEHRYQPLITDKVVQGEIGFSDCL